MDWVISCSKTVLITVRVRSRARRHSNRQEEQGGAYAEVAVVTIVLKTFAWGR